MLTGASLASAADVVRAEDNGRLEFRGAVQLAEIVVPAQPDSGRKNAKSAAELRTRAKAYQEPAAGSTPAVVVPEEEEEGLLGPRRQPESRAAEIRGKVRQYQQGQGTTQIPVPAAKDAANQGASTAERAQENRARARSYVSTDSTALVIERMGSDGIPIVSCGKLVDNVAGRIGDDIQPGGVFVIMRDNKPFKFRCSQP